MKLYSFLAVFVLALWPSCFAQAEYTCANLFQFPELAPLKPSLAHYDSIQEANLQVRYQKLVDFIDRQNTLPSTGNPFIDVTRFSAGYDLIEEMVPAIKRSIEVNYPLEMSENLLSGRRSDVTVEVIEDSIVANLVDVSLHSNLWNVYVKLRVQQTLPGDPHPHTSIVEESFAIREDGLSVYWPRLTSGKTATRIPQTTKSWSARTIACMWCLLLIGPLRIFQTKTPMEHLTHSRLELSCFAVPETNLETLFLTTGKRDELKSSANPPRRMVSFRKTEACST